MRGKGRFRVWTIRWDLDAPRLDFGWFAVKECYQLTLSDRSDQSDQYCNAIIWRTGVAGQQLRQEAR